MIDLTIKLREHDARELAAWMQRQSDNLRDEAIGVQMRGDPTGLSVRVNDLNRNSAVLFDVARQMQRQLNKQKA